MNTNPLMDLIPTDHQDLVYGDIEGSLKSWRAAWEDLIAQVEAGQPQSELAVELLADVTAFAHRIAENDIDVERFTVVEQKAEIEAEPSRQDQDTNIRAVRGEGDEARRLVDIIEYLTMHQRMLHPRTGRLTIQASAGRWYVSFWRHSRIHDDVMGDSLSDALLRAQSLMEVQR